MLGRTTPGKVRTGRTIEDYSPSTWTSYTRQAEIIHLQTNSFHIMKHHSRSPPPSTPALNWNASPCRAHRPALRPPRTDYRPPDSWEHCPPLPPPPQVVVRGRVAQPLTLLLLALIHIVKEVPLFLSLGLHRSAVSVIMPAVFPSVQSVRLRVRAGQTAVL